MNTTFRAGWLAVIILCIAGRLSAQNQTQEDLLRADKQFDLYAYNLALRTYQEVLQKEPKNAHAMARIGDCYFQLNRPDESLPNYDRAVQQRDVEPEVLLRYGKALMQTGDYVGAKKWFREYMAIDRSVGQHYADMCDYATQTAQKDGLYVARNEPLNTEASDYSAAFLGTRVVYNSARTDISRKLQSKSSADWSGSAYNQLFVTQRNAETGFLQKPAFLRSDLQNAYNEGPATFSLDGKRVAFCRNNYIDGTRQIAEKGLNMSLYTADVAENGSWTNIKPFPFNGSDYATGYPGLSPDGNTLLFASTQEGGFGGWDIYVSNWTAAGWSTPRNLGAPLNTPGNEVTPFYDGRNMYFSSDWHPGLGGMDVFRAELGQQEITNIYHLGPGINSSRDDYGFVYNSDQNIGYVTSNRPGGRGNEDIWQVTKKWNDAQAGTSVLPNPTTTATPQTYSATPTTPQTYSATPTTPQTYSAGSTTPAIYSAENPNGYLYLLVTDEQTNPLPNTEVDFLDCGAGTGRTDGSGKYYFEALSRPVDCKVNLSRDGYQDATVSLYSFGKQNVIVSLSRDKRQEFAGKVLDARTKDPLYSVIVQFQIPGTDRLIQTSTDYDGRYSIFVEPNISYDITYSKEAYVDATVKTRPGGYASGNKIADVLLDRPYTNSTAANTPYTGSQSPVTTVAPTQYSTPSTVKPQTTTLYSPLTQQQAIAQQAQSPLTGYSIQVAASPDNLPEEKLKSFEALSKFGNIYVKTESAVNKVRLGIFPNKEEAVKNLKEINKNKKFKDAFLVEERGGDQSLVLGPPAASETIRPSEYSTGPTAKGLTTPATTPSILYSVQLASFGADKPININEFAGVAGLGNVYTKQENGMTKVRVGVWGEHANAEATQNEVVARGFRDAIVVTEKANDESIKGFQIPATGVPSAKQIAPAQYSTSPASQKTVQRPVEYSTPTTSNPYWVKIAALTNPERFESSSLENIGSTIEKRKMDNGLTVILLGSYPDLESANLAQNRVRNKGYEGTYVVKDVNGRLLKQ